MLEYVPEYGMIFDTISALMLLCNKGHEEQVKEDTGLCNESIEWIQEALTVPDEIMSVFFSVNANKSKSFMQYFFYTHDMLLKPCSMEQFCNELLVKEKVLPSLMEYYFSSICVNYSESSIRKMILGSSYDSLIKLHIWGVVSEPQYYLDELIAYMKLNYNKIAYYYKCNIEVLLEIKSQIVSETLFDIDRKLSAETEYGTIYYSIVMLSKSTLVRRGLGYFNDKENVVFILGPYWKERLQKYTDDTEVDLVLFGKILSEENRYKIIQYLLQHKEITISEAVSLLKTSVTATNYHLNMMANERMLITRNEGRKLFFSLNREYFEKIVNRIHLLTEQI